MNAFPASLNPYDLILKVGAPDDLTREPEVHVPKPEPPSDDKEKRILEDELRDADAHRDHRKKHRLADFIAGFMAGQTNEARRAADKPPTPLVVGFRALAKLGMPVPEMLWGGDMEPTTEVNDGSPMWPDFPGFSMILLNKRDKLELEFLTLVNEMSVEILLAPEPPRRKPRKRHIKVVAGTDDDRTKVVNTGTGDVLKNPPAVEHAPLDVKERDRLRQLTKEFRKELNKMLPDDFDMPESNTLTESKLGDLDAINAFEAELLRKCGKTEGLILAPALANAAFHWAASLAVLSEADAKNLARKFLTLRSKYPVPLGPKVRAMWVEAATESKE